MSQQIELRVPTTTGYKYVTAFTTDTPGLVINQDTLADTWAVTHLSSGRVVVQGLPDKATAMRRAAVLGQPLTPPDWQVDRAFLHNRSVGLFIVATEANQ